MSNIPTTFLPDVMALLQDGINLREHKLYFGIGYDPFAQEWQSAHSWNKDIIRKELSDTNIEFITEVYIIDSKE